ncbi:hypothetical protein [Phenylobacterium sp.]|uniref:hypothetical protein n=1 Tax=Phenylobacterium sp. TaxID=1871053 RepID=UPI003563AE29
MRSLILAALLIAAAAAPAEAQIFRRAPPSPPVTRPPPGASPAEAEIWPFPPPDPKAWWDDKRPVAPEAADPLGGRRMAGGAHAIPVDSGVDPSTYRLWGLSPLQWQLPRGDEMVLEVWVRPARSVRQSVVRIIVRRDGKAFVQARAGLACCEAGIARRMGFDAELPPGQAQAFQALKGLPLWSAPRDVRVSQGPDLAEDVCVDGTDYDLTLMVPGRARSLRRSCDTAAIGEAADVLEPVLRAALGHDGRFDVIFPGGASFAGARDAYRDLTAHGGSLKPDPHARRQPPGVAPDAGA